ncbi:MAG: DUF393 domain-containing protein [Planctomycetes bacterium]|nr:DUF393 domain-containing protein [Planctomycetota bacterium]
MHATSAAGEHAAHATEVRPIVFFDGDCGLCHRFVRFAVVRDEAARLRFAPLGGATAQREAAALRSSRVPLDSSVASTVVLVRGEALVRSRAVAQVLVELGGPWRVLGALLRLLPRALADRGYDFVAARRARWFARPDSACPLLPADLARRIEP